MRALYSGLSALIHPLMPLFLRRRLARGKEDATRMPERLGHASVVRPEGKLLWLHAASVGEAMSCLSLIEALRKHQPQWNLLLTTGTVTSAQLLPQKLPSGVIHQFVPVDTPQAVKRFLAHWRPQMALWVESELWPNLVAQARAQDCRLWLINARMSTRSAHKWQRAPGFIRSLLACFDVIYAQSEADAARYRALGAENVQCVGNLKHDAAPLPASETALAVLRGAIGMRPCWLAASIHPGEDAVIAAVHMNLKEKFPHLLTLVVPRHPHRAREMQGAFTEQGLASTLRSEGGMIDSGSDIYIADTIGELGLFYRLVPAAFIGGSLIAHGGQNPLEAARLGCAVLHGPHMENFADITEGLVQAGGGLRVTDIASLTAAAGQYLTHPEEARSAGARGAMWAEAQAGARDALLAALMPLLESEARYAA